MARVRLPTWPKESASQSRPAPAEARAFCLSTGDREIALWHGEIVIGRDSGCDLVVDEMLVSARHARLLVSRGALFIEDLGSTNGILVNEVAISGPTPLCSSDRFIIGNLEFLVRAAADPAATLPPQEPPTQPPPGGGGMPVHLPPPVVEATLPRGSDCADPAGHTEKQDGLLTMARVADRMIAMGRNDAAVRVLGDHLRGVLAKAKDGEEVPSQVRDAVALYGAKLTQISGSGAWADIAVELHLTVRRVLPEKAVAAVEAVAPLLDGELLRRYQSLLSELSRDLPLAEQAVALRVQRLRGG